MLGGAEHDLILLLPWCGGITEGDETDRITVNALAQIVLLGHRQHSTLRDGDCVNWLKIWKLLNQMWLVKELVEGLHESSTIHQPGQGLLTDSGAARSHNAMTLLCHRICV